MPTSPAKKILYRELSKVSAQTIISVASPLLQELVNHATNALLRCGMSASGQVDVDLAALALYRHIIEMTDGIEVLISQCCPTPTIPLLRSSFESLLSLEYLFEKPETYETRALCWFVSYARQRLASYERLDHTTAKGQQAEKCYKDDLVQINFQVIPPAVVQKAADNMRALLDKPHLKPIVLEDARSKNGPWYHLFGGPSNLERLAKYLKRSSLYDLLYRPWSRFVHAQDLQPFLTSTRKGPPFSVGQLRNSVQLKQVAGLTAWCQLSSTRLMIKWFRPGENLRQWYIDEVQDAYKALISSGR
jgi:hypothetical protein